MRKRRHIRTVLNKTAMVRGDKRVASFDTLAGPTTVTTHREYGISYRLDLSRVFFNPSLASERNRVAAQAAPGETVLVPFAGIGPFVLPLAKKGSFVVAVENNPDAVRWLLENIRANDAGDRVGVVEGDAFDPALYGDRSYDRAVIPAPYGMDGIVDIVSPVVRNRGMIHLYTFKKDAQIPGLIVSFLGKSLETVRWRRCGNVAPGSVPVCSRLRESIKPSGEFNRVPGHCLISGRQRDLVSEVERFGEPVGSCGHKDDFHRLAEVHLVACGYVNRFRIPFCP